MPTNFTYDVFISYSSSDLAFAEHLHQRLVGAGFCVWFDKARLNPGCDWHQEIEAGCESSRVILPVLTPRWKESKWTKFETYGADCVIPIVADGKPAEIFTPPITRFQAQQIDLAVNDESQWLRLIESIRTQLEKPEPDKLARLADVRYQSNPYFVGRVAELIQIHEELHNNPTAVLTQGRVRAIAALGGVGKTTLAREYIEQFWRCYSQIFWVDCRKGVETELARICDLLLPQYRTETDVPAKAKLAYQELLGREERLLVYDNAEDEVSLQAWIPKSGHCRTLITSRYSAWSAAIKTIHLYVLDPEPAWALLTERTGRGSIAVLEEREQDACKMLADMLGYLPLALEQAAAYVEQQGTEFLFAHYIRLYESATAELLAAGVLGSTEYPDSVITTWKATIAKLTPEAQAILRLCSFMAPTPIPISVLVNSVDEILAEVIGPVSRDGTDEAFVRKHIQQLRSYSIVSGDGKAIQLHPLVQTVERLHFEEVNRSGKIHERVVQILKRETSVDAADVTNWPTLESLKSHALAAVGFAEHTKALPNVCGGLLAQIGILELKSGRFATSGELFRRALTMDEQSFGSEHPYIARDLNNLASFLMAANRLTEAEPLLRRAFVIDVKSFGPEHPTVARDLNNLALYLRTTNRLSEAGPLLRQALVINESTYGSDHPKTAIALNNLALWLMETNCFTQAEPLMRRALAIDEKSYGPEHPCVSRRLDNLAQLLQATNRLDEAELMMRRALAIDEQSYGPEHPDVASMLNSLAMLLVAKNRLSEAEPLMRRALFVAEQCYGPAHPEVAIQLNNLASLLQTTNRFPEAEPLTRRVVSIFERSYGAGHPRVATAITNLASLLRETNRMAEAEPLMRRALSIDEQSYGPTHPDVAVDLNNLAQLLQDTNRLSEAEPLMRQQLLIFQNFRGSTGHENPHMQAALANYRSLLKALEKSESEIDQTIADLLK